VRASAADALASLASLAPLASPFTGRWPSQLTGRWPAQPRRCDFVVVSVGLIGVAALAGCALFVVTQWRRRNRQTGKVRAGKVSA
jgi:hypothetical protein